MASSQIAAAEGENEAAAFGAGEPLALPDPDWLLNRLTISGPAGAVSRFRAVAQGTNVAPWHLDLDEEEARRRCQVEGKGRRLPGADAELTLARW